MPTVLLGVVVVLLLVVLVLQVMGLRRQPSEATAPLLEELQRVGEKLAVTVREESARDRAESADQASKLRQELDAKFKNVGDSLVKTLADLAAVQRGQLETFGGKLEKLTEFNEGRLEKLRLTVETQLKAMQEDNARKLELMRSTVDEKLQTTLEKRLGESFKLVSERLEQVHKGLGEMQTLAAGVGDLKNVLTNVKTRGTWGEIQLGTLLDQVLRPEQYATNVATRPGSNERVEFAIKLPGRDDQGDQPVWLPIDAKFPIEDYQRLTDAAGRSDADGVAAAGRQLETRIKASARDIQSKYLSPPATTDFGMMFLPSEGLYAEVIRRPGLVEQLQREWRVVVAGPTTLGALLNSLQMGFRTLAIAKQSSEVWAVLGAVKTEFEKYTDVMARVQKKLTEAGNIVEQVGTRTRAIQKRLTTVEALPADQTAALLPDLADGNHTDAADEASEEV